MDIYEITYLITVNTQLGGQAFQDTLAAIFAIVLTGYFVGPRLTKPMLWGLTAISASFVIPMIFVVNGILQRIVALGESLPAAQLDQLPYLVHFVQGAGILPTVVATAAMPLSLAAAYGAAIYFVFHSHRNGSVTAQT